MAARDDSVIRGSLIACMILLVLSFAVNYFFWKTANLASKDAADIKARLETANNGIRDAEEKILTFKEMLGVGQMSDEKFKSLATSSSGDPQMDTITAQYVKDMAVFGAEIDAASRNYQHMPEFFVSTIRDRNVRIKTGLAREKKIDDAAKIDIKNARTQQQQAETDRNAASKKLQEEQALFAEDRNRMLQEKEETRDTLTKTVNTFNIFRGAAAKEKAQLTKKQSQLTGTIEAQRLALIRLRSDQFESVQGEVRFVLHGGDLCTINLGSADALRVGVTFGVIDATETRLKDARVKASLQVTRIRGEHLAECRIVSTPEIDSPIIEGDKIYSPWWSPGVAVKIALAGDIDIDGDGRADNEAIRGMITSAGAVVAATINSDGTQTGKLDASIRFLVIGESPRAVAGSASEERLLQIEKQLGEVRDQATELGLTVIPAWKLQAYLRTIDDTVTTPLGSAVRASDFQPPDARRNSRIPVDVSDTFRRDTSRIQKDNQILEP